MDAMSFSLMRHPFLKGVVPAFNSLFPCPNVQDRALSLANAAPNSTLLGYSEATDDKDQVASSKEFPSGIQNFHLHLCCQQLLSFS